MNRIEGLVHLSRLGEQIEPPIGIPENTIERQQNVCNRGIPEFFESKADRIFVPLQAEQGIRMLKNRFGAGCESERLLGRVHGIFKSLRIQQSCRFRIQIGNDPRTHFPKNGRTLKQIGRLHALLARRLIAIDMPPPFRNQRFEALVVERFETPGPIEPFETAHAVLIDQIAAERPRNGVARPSVSFEEAGEGKKA